MLNSLNEQIMFDHMEHQRARLQGRRYREPRVLRRLRRAA
jgi:hypothetical protein